MIYAQHERFTLHQGDNRDVLKEIADNSIDSIVTDPPYELGFMGKKWDGSGIAFNVEVWQECLRVLKPGGHLLAFSGSRTYHRMAVAIEDAGFEIRDQIMWIYGSGFPKSLDVSKAIDKAAGVEREVVGGVTDRREDGTTYGLGHSGILKSKDGITTEAKQWQGWGTALKPAHEPIVVARKPLVGTVAENVLTFGTGGLNIDANRIKTEDSLYRNSSVPRTNQNFNEGWKRPWQENKESIEARNERTRQNSLIADSLGRWPANVVLDEFTATDFNEARFFYVAKASKRDRNEGLDGFEIKEIRGGGGGRVAAGYDETTQDLKEAARKYGAVKTAKANIHPTVKPTSLMKYLCKLVTPPNGIVLDLFMGSGSTGKAAIYEGFNFVGIEMTEEYLPIAKARIEFALSDEGEKLL